MGKYYTSGLDKMSSQVSRIRLIYLALFVAGITLSAQEPSKSTDVELDRQYCFDCHQCAHPTAEDPCLKSCPHRIERRAAHDSPTVDYPDIIQIGDRSGLYEPVVFFHRYHAEMCMMGQGCASCHHSGAAGEFPPCGECHSSGETAIEQVNLEQPGLKGAYHRQCMDCHISWRHGNECSSCHVPLEATVAGRESQDLEMRTVATRPRISAELQYIYDTGYTDGPLVTFHHEDHTILFGQGCVDCHQGDACGRCHEVGRSQLAELDLHDACMDCHPSEDCGICHRNSSTPSFDHAITVGWDLNSQHQELACAVCHGPTVNFQVPSPACANCHSGWDVDNFDHEVTGIMLNEDHEMFDCADCHAGARYSESPACDTCHDDDVEYPRSLPGTWID